ncbi:MAG: S46 family peptidase, partial [bacterium]
MIKHCLVFIAFVLFLVLPGDQSYTEEGMYPISVIHKLDLKSKGLQIDPKDIFNPNGISLIDGIVQVGGCSGSFVSSKGLILTNHHCAYRAVQSASTAENDYIQHGFLAANQSEEIPARGYTARITESYRDVSAEVLSAVNDQMDLAERTKAIEKKMKEMVKAAEKEQPGKRAEVSEMFIGKTYVLFIYTYLKDVRLVYAPPRSIGEFGGDIDNWEWPRHTGDFSFMRA